MKILHVVPSYIPAWRYGGPIHSVHGLCKALVAQGHEIHVFTTNVDGPGNSDVPLNTAVDIDGVQVWYFPSERLRRIYYSPPMMNALKARIKEFDLVHLHSVFLWPTWTAARVARAANVPYVISPRGMLVKDLIRRKSRMLKSLWLALIERRNIEHAVAIHVTSKAESDELQKFGYKLPKIYLVPNGVDMPVQWSKDGVSEDVRKTIDEGEYVLYLGRINWKKGLDCLLKVWADVSDKRLIIAGNDEEDYLVKLKAIVGKAGVSDRVHFIPRSVKGPDKEALFSKASLFVLPSYSENFGITVLEAMVRGLPVLVTEEVGAKDVVRASGGGVVVSADKLGERMNELLLDADDRSSMGLQGKKWVVEHLTWDKVAAQMGQYYEKITGRK